MTGRLIALVGPSGVGKDTVIAALRARRPDLHWVRRVITRPGDAGSEPFEGVTEAEFAERLAAGEFLLSWRAHGLSYGIPKSECACLARGQDALVNLSRRALVDAAAKVPELIVIALTASPEVLAHRLADRGREDPADIASRLRRADERLPTGIAAIRIDNSGALADTVAMALRALYPERV